jgi:hypothetical protein
MADDPTEPRTHSPTRARSGYSKQILRRQRLTTDLVSSLETHEDDIVAALGEVLAPFVDEGERLELRTLLRALRRLIQNREDRLQQAAYHRNVEAYEDRLRRVELGERTAEVRELLLDLRRTAAGYYGKELADAFLGLEARTGRYSREVLADGETVLERLADPEMALPERRFKHAELVREEWHDLLEGPVRELARAVDAHHQDQGETGDAVTLKDLELERHDHDVNWAARWVVAMYSLAGKEPWASDLSPVSRHRQRRGRTSKTPSAEPTSQDAQG